MNIHGILLSAILIAPARDARLMKELNLTIYRSTVSGTWGGDFPASVKENKLYRQKKTRRRKSAGL
ncbi:MAG: hypothetical protein IKK41_04855 [Oscillospiraceae bacterium]|nr:hypothetical protein [Oscillospiraceae bacterium]